MTYYILNPDGTIFRSSPSENELKRQYPGMTVLSTSEDIVAGPAPNYGAYLASQRPPDPPPALEELREARRAEILAELEEIDQEGRRPSRAVAWAKARDLPIDPGDAAKLDALETRAEKLRVEWRTLKEQQA